MDKFEFGLRLKLLRKQRNLTQIEFAEMLCICEKSLSRIEAGRTYPRFASIISLSEALGVSIDYLIADKDAENEELYIQEITCRIKGLSTIKLKHILRYIELCIETEHELKKASEKNIHNSK